jgi:hypothetical protein
MSVYNVFMLYNIFHGFSMFFQLYEKFRLLGEVDKEAGRPIWQVKQRWGPAGSIPLR